MSLCKKLHSVKQTNFVKNEFCFQFSLAANDSETI